MNRTIIRISWLNLKRDRVALGLTFILPIAFFSIFALIFGSMSIGGGGDGISGTKVIIIDLDDSDVSRRFAEEIGKLDAVAPITQCTVAADDGTMRREPYDEEAARAAIIAGEAAAAIIIPDRFGATFGTFGGEAESIRILYDAANPIAQMALPGLMQAAAMQAAPDVLMQRGLDTLGTFGGGLTPMQQQAVDTITPFLRGERDWSELDDAKEANDASAGAPADNTGFAGLVRVTTENARQNPDDDDASSSADMVSYYAAGIGVMFLLFSMAGAGGSLLQEEQQGTLERLLTSNVSMTRLLLSHWVFFAVIGAVQLTVMFLWGALVFGLSLFTPVHLAGFAVMTLGTVMAAAAFGIVLATLCRSQSQLSGMSTIIILVMSALGGSMVPKFVAPGVFDTTSLFTFNGWALDGYLQIFWHTAPGTSVAAALGSITPTLGVLLGMTAVFLLIARGLARRWETV
jgi:ABC-2 type transport system permease protein